MSVLTRRRFVLLSTVPLLSAACAPSEPVAAGLRGSGTVLRPRELEAVVIRPDPTSEPTRVPIASPTVRPTPAAESDREPIVPADAVPSPVTAETYAQAHVVPVPSRLSTVQPLPARR